MKKYGLIIDEIVPDKDYVLGGFNSLGGEVLQADGQWLPFLPPIESQLDANGFDAIACASFGTLNALEMLARRVYAQERNWSDRFLATTSETTPQGNSPHKVAETLRKLGVPAETDWPYLESITTWYQFYSSIPQRVYQLALAFLAEFDFKHEYVVTQPGYLKQALQYSPLGISVSAWYKNADGLFYKPAGMQDNHWCVLVGYKEGEYWLVFDSYNVAGEGDESFIKKVKWDTPFQIAKRYSLNRQVKVESFWVRFLKWLGLETAETVPSTIPPAPITPPAPPNSPVDESKPPTAPSVPSTATLTAFCLAIREFEGWYPGSRSYRNNNPGNCRYSSVGYATMYKPVTKDSGGFAVFKDYATGWLYLQNLVRAKISANPNQTILDFIEVYAPAEDHNDPAKYAAHIGKRLGVDYKTFLMKNLLASA